MFNYDLSGKNKYYKLYSYIRDDILRGKITEGERLPSKRALAADLGVSVMTVQFAYDQLLAEGYIRSKERSGFYVEKVASVSLNQATNQYFNKEKFVPQKYRIDLVNGNTPPNMFPFSVWARLMRAVLADCGEHLLERVPCDGDYELKKAVSSYLYRSRGIDVDPKYIVVGAGAEHLYGVIVQLLGRDCVFAVENPGYGRISSTYVLNGARVVPVDVNGIGMNTDMLEKSGAHAVHVSPAHQFPTGAVMPVSVRSKLIDLAKATDGYVIEDDYDSEFRLTGKPLQCTYCLCPERVIYMNTFSKTLAPSMRMGYMVLPPDLYKKFEQVFSSSASIVPLFEQKALAAMLDSGCFERHLSRLRNHYRGVRRVLLEEIRKRDEGFEIFDTGSGLHFVVKFPQAKSDEEIKLKAQEDGVNIKCVSDYLLAPMPGAEKRAVINYCGLTEDLIK